MAKYTRESFDRTIKILEDSDNITNRNNPMYSLILKMILLQDRLEQIDGDGLLKSLGDEETKQFVDLINKSNGTIDGMKELYWKGKNLIEYVPKVKKHEETMDNALDMYRAGMVINNSKLMSESARDIDYLLTDIDSETKRTLENSTQVKIKVVGRATKWTQLVSKEPDIDYGNRPIPPYNSAIPPYNPVLNQSITQPSLYTQEPTYQMQTGYVASSIENPIQQNNIRNPRAQKTMRELQKEKERNKEKWYKDFFKKHQKLVIFGVAATLAITYAGLGNNNQELVVMQGETPPKVESQYVQPESPTYQITNDNQGRETIILNTNQPQAAPVVVSSTPQNTITKEQIAMKTYSYYIDSMDDLTKAAIVSELKDTYLNIRAQNMQEIKNMSLGLEKNATDDEYLRYVFEKLDATMSRDYNHQDTFTYGDTVKAILGGIIKSSIVQSYGNTDFENVEFKSYFKDNGQLRSVDVRYPDSDRIVAKIGSDGSSNCNKDMQAILTCYLQLENALDVDPGFTWNNSFINNGTIEGSKTTIEIFSGKKEIKGRQNGKGFDLKEIERSQDEYDR